MASESDAFSAYSKIQALLEVPGDQEEYDAPIEQDFVAAHQTMLEENGAANKGFDFASLNINEETFENKLHPDEGMFCKILQSMMVQQHSTVLATFAADNFEDAEISSRYSAAAGRRLVDFQKELSRATEINHLHHSRIEEWQLSHIHTGVQDYRAERDLWSLLAVLSQADLLVDVDDTECDNALNEALCALPPSASIPDFINAAFMADLRLRKGEVLKDWCERGSADQLTAVVMAPHSAPLSDTLRRITMDAQRGTGGRSVGIHARVESVHPDAQTTLRGLVLPLDGSDQAEQESLLKYIWQLLRTGNLLKAQQVASDHQVYWLASLLQGAASHEYISTDSDDVSGCNSDATLFRRQGNALSPHWLLTMWKLAEHLASNPDNRKPVGAARLSGGDCHSNNVIGDRSAASLSGLLEMAVYAALCNHTALLRDSPLVPCWQDKLWMYIKAVHERDMMGVTLQYRSLKSEHSGLYVGCSAEDIQAEREMLSLAEAELGGISMSSRRVINLFKKVSPPHPTESMTAAAFILNLQMAVIEGMSGIRHFLDTTFTDYLRNSRPGNTDFVGAAQILRICCHFAIWLRYSSEAAGLRGLMSDGLFELTIERYIDHLTAHKQRHLVATYCVYLSRDRRIRKYALLLNSIEESSASSLAAGGRHVDAMTGQSVTSVEVIQLAKGMFPADVLDITRMVIEGMPDEDRVEAEEEDGDMDEFEEGREQESGRICDVGGTGTPNAQRGTILARRGVAFAASPSPSRITSTAQGLRRGGTGVATPSSSRAFRKSKMHVATPAARGRGSEIATPCSTTDINASSHKKRLHIMSSKKKSPAISSMFASFEKEQVCQRRDESDAACLQALRWLFIDREHRIEAVKQSNRLIDKFVLESHGDRFGMASRVSNLLTNHLPLDSVVEGFAIMRYRREQLEDDLNLAVQEQRQQREDATAVPGGELDVYIKQLQAAIRTYEVEYGQWEADVTKLELWRSLVAAMDDVQAASALQQDLKMQLNRLVGAEQTVFSSVGRFRLKLDKVSTVAVEALTRTVRCAAFSTDIPEDTVRATGFRDVYRRLECSAVKSITHLLTNLHLKLEPFLAHAPSFAPRRSSSSHDGDFADRIVGLASPTAGGEEMNRSGSMSSSGTSAAKNVRGNGSAAEAASNSSPLDMLIGECDGLLEWTSSLYPTDAAGLQVPRTLLDALLTALDIVSARLQTLSEEQLASDAAAVAVRNEDLMVDLRSALQQCNLLFGDIHNARVIAQDVLAVLMSTYLELCVNTADAFRSLNLFDEACAWYTEAMQLSTLVASEETGLQLYALLPMDDLELLLEGINKATISLMELCPTASVFGPRLL